MKRWADTGKVGFVLIKIWTRGIKERLWREVVGLLHLESFE